MYFAKKMRSARLGKIWRVALLCGLAVGCAKKDSPIGPDPELADLAVPMDSATPTDSAMPADSAVPADSAMPTDAGMPADAGMPRDAGMPADAAVPGDGGTPDGGVMTGSLCSESGWCPIEPELPATIRAFWSFSASDIWAAGDAGTILHWNGTSWTRVATNTHYGFSGLWAAAPNDIWAVGLGAYHYDGTSWSLPSGAENVRGNAIHGSARDDIWTASYSGNVYHYTIGGWKELPVAGGSINLYGIYASSRTNAWVAGSGGTLLRWDGTRWNGGMSPSPMAYFVSMWGTTANDVWLTDGTYGWHWDGSAWTKDAGFLSFGGTIKPLWGRASNDVWSPGDRTRLDHYDGTSWKSVAHGLDEGGYVRFGIGGCSVSATDVWLSTAYGGLAHGDGTTFAWVKKPPPLVSRNAVWATGPSDIWVLGGTARHFNGTTWSDATLPPYAELRAVWGASASDVYAAGDGGTLLHFDGTKWSKISGIPTTTWNLNALWGSGPSDIYAMGSNGNLSRWDGSTWKSAWSGATTQNIRGLWGFGPADIWGVGDGGTIIHKTPAGWTKDTRGSDLKAVWGAAANDIWAVGKNGSTVHYDGTSWNSVANPAQMDYATLYALRGSSASDVWAAGDNGSLYHYDGTSWKRALSGTPEILSGMWWSAATGYYLVGRNGTILRRP